jgi:PAS domain S-box-containing protein
MKKIGHFKYHRVVLAYTVILLVFLSIVISVIQSHHHEMMRDVHDSAHRELKLIGTFARDALLRLDYASVEYFLNDWAIEHKEIIELRAVAPNNFVLVDFHRSFTSSLSFHLEETVSYEGRQLIHLQMIKDMSPAEISMLSLRFRLIIGSVLITILFGLVLWYVMRKLALAPMEKEIAMKEQTERKVRILIESAPDSIVYTDAEGKIIMINEQTERLFGYPRKELEGKDVEVLMPERFRERHRQVRAKFVASPDIRSMGQNLELLGYTKDGGEFPADISLSPIKMEEGLFILSSIRDISERKIAERKIKRGHSFQTTISRILLISLQPIPLEEQLQQILDIILSIPDLSLQSMGCIYLMSKDAKSISLAAQRGLPASEASKESGLPLSQSLCYTDTEDSRISFVDCTERELREHRMCMYEFSHSHYCVPITSGESYLGGIDLIVQQDHRRSSDEESFLSSVANTIAGIIVHSKTDAERQKLQEELAQTEKMSALGRLTANVAHEIRTPLTLIGGFTRRLSRNIARDSKDREYADIVIAEVNRLEKILKNVLTYSRVATLRRTEQDMNGIVEEVLKTFQHACINRSVEVQKEFGTPSLISIDKDQVWIVLNNIFANALDSMPREGKITITTENASIRNGDYLAVTITDTGKGIPEEQIKAIFEPFYSTKVIGRGTGLGLAISKKIMEDHGGFIKVDSSIDRGTTFRLFFPRNGFRSGE